MPQLCLPTPDVHASFLTSMAEFEAEGRGIPEDTSLIGRDLRDRGGQWSDPAVFREYVTRTIGQSRDDAPRPGWMVPSTTLWWLDGQEFLARISIRHRLTPALLEWGGHIGYDVRPAARRRGHATAMLAAARPVAAGLGVSPRWSPATGITPGRGRSSRRTAASWKTSAAESCGSGCLRPEPAAILRRK